MALTDKLTAIADAIRDKSGITDLLTLDNMVTNVADVYDTGYLEGHVSGYEAGKKSQYDEFWDSFQDGGRRTNYNGAFRGTNPRIDGGWTDTTFKPKYPMCPTDSGSMFYYSNITDIENTAIDFSNSTSFGYMFQGSLVKFIGVMDVTSCTELLYTFFAGYSIQRIKKMIVNENNVFTHTFRYCNVLSEIEFEGDIGNDINFAFSPLTLESARSIINALYNYSGTDITHTLTLSTTTKALLSDGDRATITQKGWTLA